MNYFGLHNDIVIIIFFSRFINLFYSPDYLNELVLTLQLICI